MNHCTVSFTISLRAFRCLGGVLGEEFDAYCPTIWRKWWFLFRACWWQRHISVSVREAWDLSASKLTGQEMCTKQSFSIFEGDIIQRRQTWRKWRQQQTIIAARNTSLVCLISVSCWDKNKLLIQLVWIAIQLNRVRGVMCVAPYYYGTAQLHNLMVKCSAHWINSAHNCCILRSFDEGLGHHVNNQRSPIVTWSRQESIIVTIR